MIVNGYVLASKYLVDYRMRVGYMYREKAEGNDSGWRFFAGSETNEYLADPTHVGMYDIKTILELDPSVEPYLDVEPGTELTRIKGTNRFEAKPALDRESFASFGYVFATKMLVDNRLPVMFMYREQGEDGDSGWRFFCGSEDQAYVDNIDNIDIYDIKTILEIDGSIEPYLDAENGTAFERKDVGAPFQIVKDFSFEPEGE